MAEQQAFGAALGAPGLSASSGIVAYRIGVAGGRQLAWLDRSGKSAGSLGAFDNAGLANVELSPDGKRVAVQRAVNGSPDVWLIDTGRGIPTRFTFGLSQRPLWSPDGRRIAFDSIRKGVINLYWKLSSGAGSDELLLESDQNKITSDWSSDGRFLMFRVNAPQTGYDLWILPVSGDKKPFPFVPIPPTIRPPP